MPALNASSGYETAACETLSTHLCCSVHKGISHSKALLSGVSCQAGRQALPGRNCLMPCRCGAGLLLAAASKGREPPLWPSLRCCWSTRSRWLRMKRGQLAVAGSTCRPHGGEKHRHLLQPALAKTWPGQQVGTHRDGHKAGLQTWYLGASAAPGMDTGDARKRKKSRAGFLALFLAII